MAQGFDCFCGADKCRGRIEGAGRMTAAQLEGMWLNGFIREMLEERKVRQMKKLDGGRGWGRGVHGAAAGKSEDYKYGGGESNGNGDGNGHGEYMNGHGIGNGNKTGESNGRAVDGKEWNGCAGESNGELAINGDSRMGPTSRELSGEMGGDTTA